MENSIAISDEAFNKIVDGIEKGNFWLLYDNKKLLLDPADVDQFKSKGEAFPTIAGKEINDDHALIYAPTIQDVLLQIPYETIINHISSSQNKSVMNQENLKFLQDRLFYLGTEKRLHPELEKNMAEGKPEFKLSFSNHHDKDKLSAELHLRKSETNDMYFLNKYDATLQKPGQESKSQTFYLENGRGVTMKEAYNLLDGRSVNRDLKNKEGEVKNAWIKLDFASKEPNGNFKQEQFYKNYGFDLQSELNKLPLAPMPPEKITQIVESLQRGNIQEIKLDEKTTGIPGSLFINANPKFKTLDLSDEHGKPLSREEKSNIYQMTPDQKTAIVEKANENIKANPDIFPDQKLNPLPT